MVGKRKIPVSSRTGLWVMTMKRACAILLILTTVHAAPMLAEIIKLKPHTHRDKWADRNTGEVIKDFEWTTTCLIEARDNGENWIRITHRCVVHIDRTREDEDYFKRMKSVVGRIEILLGDGMQWNLTGMDRKIGPDTWDLNYPVSKQQILSIAIKCYDFHGGYWYKWYMRKPTQSQQRALSQAQTAVNAAAEMPRAARLRLMGRIAGLLAPHAEADGDIAVGAALIDLERDRQEMLDDKLEIYLDKIRDAPDETQHAKAWRRLRMEMLQRSAHFMRNLNNEEITEADARRLLEIVKYGSQAVDDLKDLSPQGGATSELTRFLTYAHGVAALAEGVENPDARMIMEGLRDTVGTVEKKIRHLGVSMPSPVVSIIDIPGEVAASMIDVSRDGLDQATDTMKHIEAGLDGDKEALARAAESSKKIEKILSSENYGKAMAEAMTDRIIDKIPFLRTIVAWFKPTDTPNN